MNDQNAQRLRQLRDELRQTIKQRVASIVRFAQVTASSATGYADKVQGNETLPDEDPGGYDYTTRRLWPFGIRSVPPPGVDGVVVHAFGGPTNAVLVGAESSEYGPGDLAEGEVAIYAKAAGAVIKIDTDGKITITSTTAQPVEVVAGSNVTITANGGAGTVDINANAVTVGPNPILAVLVQGALDSMGVPVTQSPASISTLKSS